MEEKCRIVEQTLKPGASVARVALAHGVNANQVFSWRRQYRQGLLGKRNALPVNLLPVHVSEARRLCDALLTTAPSKVSIYFPSGHSRVGQWKRSAESCASATRATDAPGFKVCST